MPQMGYRVEAVDVQAAPEEQLRMVAGLMGRLGREAIAEDPKTPAEVLIGQMRGMPASMRRWDWVGRDPEGAPVARATAWCSLEGEKRHVRNMYIGVLPDHRRRGVGRALFEEIVRTVGENDTLFGAFTSDRVPAGEAFMRRLGAEAGLRTTTNQLDLASLDPALVERWREAAPRGYRLEWIDGDVPERLIPNVIAAFEALNTTPQGTLRIWDFSATPESVRAFDRARQASGRQRWILLALADDGSTAGFTQVSFHRAEPHVAYQNATAVAPAHQGRDIAKWLKGVMMTRVVADLPRALYMRTMNATINPPILSINERLGFRAVWTNTVWQLPIADARRYVAEHRAT